MGSATSKFLARRRGNLEGHNPGTSQDARIRGLPMRASDILLHLVQSELERELLAIQRILSQLREGTPPAGANSKTVPLAGPELEWDVQIISSAIEKLMNAKQIEKSKTKATENKPEAVPQEQVHQAEAGTETLVEIPRPKELPPLVTPSILADMAATPQSELEDMLLAMQSMLSSLKGEEPTISHPKLRNIDDFPFTKSQLQIFSSAVEKVLNDKQIEVETNAKAKETHPLLLNVEVMQKIFNSVPLKSLRYLRQVCSTWWSASLPRVRQNYRMHLVGYQDLPDRRDYPFLTSWITTSQNDPFQFETNPIQKYIIDFREQPLVHVSSQTKKNLNQIIPFWNAFGPLVHDLKIRDLKNPCESASVPTWVEFLEHFPNLEKLHLEAIENGSQSIVNAPYHQLNSILKAIQILKEKWGNQRAAITGLNIMNARRHGIFYFVNATIHRFDVLRLPLTSLALDIGIYMIKRGLKLLLEYHAPTIQKLVLYRASFQPPYPDFELGVRMNSLTELGLFGPICENLLFLKYTPNLKVLKLMDESGSDDVSKPFPHLSEEPMDFITREGYEEEEFQNEELQITDPYAVVEVTDFTQLENCAVSSLQVFIGGHEECSPEQIEALAKLMPGLCRLRISVRGVDGLKAICKNWKDMIQVEVTMLGNVWADDFDEAGLGVEGPEDEEDGVSMLHLRYISVESVFVSDALVDRHLIRLPDWIQLSVNACKMSDQAYYALIKKFPRTAIHRYASC
ncbi:hypothetical protein Ocin01_13663 [Orchesella cincta]|uniref:F-box domain-containing protein n=1 Tax=Orchesella cincta TaxID=48709 RepID=A0A1D2MJ37_ORCCI|nr:hypothetical protein Ocin01_13663 [Orchesella cincta]